MAEANGVKAVIVAIAATSDEVDNLMVSDRL